MRLAGQDRRDHRRRPRHRPRDRRALRRRRRAGRRRRPAHRRGQADGRRDRRRRRGDRRRRQPARIDRSDGGSNCRRGRARSTSWSTAPRYSTWRRWPRSPRRTSTGSSTSMSAACCSPRRSLPARMIAAGKGGKIINFSSQAGRRGEAHVAVYCATKAAVISLTQSMALELIKHRINVNAHRAGRHRHADVGRGRLRCSPSTKNRPIGEKKRLVGRSGAVRPHGRSRRHHRRGGVSGELRQPTTSLRRRSMSTAATG